MSVPAMTFTKVTDRQTDRNAAAHKSEKIKQLAKITKW